MSTKLLQADVKLSQISDEQLAQMARDYAAAIDSTAQVRTTFLQMLVARTQALLRNRRGPTAAQIRESVRLVYDRMYGVVLHAIVTDDLKHDDKLSAIEKTRRAVERNRRSNFARTAKYALDAWLDAGGKLMTVKASEVTKEFLRRLTPARDGSGATGLVRSAARTGDRLVKVAAQLVAEDRDLAERTVEGLITKLQQLIAKPLTRTRIKRGEITLTPAPSSH